MQSVFTGGDTGEFNLGIETTENRYEVKHWKQNEPDRRIARL